jgi:DNA-binding NarL/FixJ family response regulator
VNKKRIILAIDHPIVLAGLRHLIQHEHDLEISGTASTALAAFKLIQDSLPDLVVVDISKSVLTGIGLLHRIAEQGIALRTLMLSRHEDRAHVRQALQAGAHGYVLKRSASEHFIVGIRAVLAGGTYIDPTIAGKMFKIESGSRGRRLEEHAAADLTERETDVLKLVALGFTNKEIAHQLGIGVKSVETYKARGSEKLGLKTRVELVRYALAQDWLAKG